MMMTGAMPDWPECLVVAALAIWFAGTVVHQIFLRRSLLLARRWDVFRLVPALRLYGKIPLERRLYLRDRDPAGRLSEWRLVPLRLSRQPWRFLFNPDYREADAILSTMEFICGMVLGPEPRPPERIARSVASQILWRAVACRPPELAGASARQFAIRQQELTHGAMEELVYASEFQPLAVGKGAK